MLARLPGDRALSIADRLDAVVAGHARARGRSAEPWTEADCWLIAYPDQFSDGVRPPLAVLGSELARLAPEINGVHVLPFHPSSGDGGFSVVDHDVVAPDLGDWDDIEALGRSCRLMADAVVNHTSASGRWFMEYLAGRRGRAGFFREVDPGTDLTAVVRPRASSPVTRFARADGSPVDIWTTFGPDQVDLDFREPEVLLAVADVVCGYAARGASAIRLDAIAYVGKREGTPSIHLPETHTIVELFRACLDEIDPGVLLVTETNVPHAENLSYLGTTGRREAQAVYQFSLPPLVLYALATGDAAPLRRWATDLEDLPAGRSFLNFLASHDGVGLRPVEGILEAPQIDALADLCRSVGGIVNTHRRSDGTQRPYELTSTWFELCAAGHGESAARRRHLCSHAVMLALRGIPLLYVHSVFGSRNDTAGSARTGLGRDLNRRRFGPAGPGAVGNRMWASMRPMIAARRRHPAFHPDAGQRILAATDGVFAVERTAAHGGRVVVGINLSGEPGRLDLGGSAEWLPLGGGAPCRGELRLDGWSSVWLRSAGSVVSPC